MKIDHNFSLCVPLGSFVVIELHLHLRDFLVELEGVAVEIRSSERSLP